MALPALPGRTLGPGTQQAWPWAHSRLGHGRTEAAQRQMGGGSPGWRKCLSPRARPADSRAPHLPHVGAREDRERRQKRERLGPNSSRRVGRGEEGPTPTHSLRRWCLVFDPLTASTVTAILRGSFAREREDHKPLHSQQLQNWIQTLVQAGG